MARMNINAGAKGNPLDALISQNGGNLWGSSGGMMYQYGRDSQGRDTFGPGTDEAGNPLGNQDGSMIGSQDPRHGALSDALSQYGPGWVQIRNTNIGGPGGVIDPSSVRYDPVAGLVTHASNLNAMADDTGTRMAIVLAPALAGMALGAVSGAGLGAGYGESASALAGAGEGAGAGTMTGLAGDESAGLSMANPFEAGGLAGDESAGLSMANPFDGTPAGGGFNPATGEWTDLQPMNEIHAGELPGLDTYNGGSSNLLSQLNRARQYVNTGRSIMNLANGPSGSPGRSGMSGGNTNDFLSALFGGNGSSGGSLLGGILGLLGAGHQAFGNGIGTPNGALDVANHASAIADPWAPYRQPFQQALAGNALNMLGIGQSPADQITSNPAYQFELQQGTNAINTGDAAQGTLRSGNRLLDLQKYGTGLASTFWQQNQASNLANLSALSGLAGVNAGSPTASAQALLGGWDNASNLRNAGVNGLFGGGRGNPLLGGANGGILGMLGQAGSGIYNWLTGGNGGFDMSNVNFGSLPDFNDTSGWNPGDFFTDDGGGFADATGAFF